MSYTKLQQLSKEKPKSLIGASLKCICEGLDYFTKGEIYKVLEVDVYNQHGLLDDDDDKTHLNYLDTDELGWFELVEVQKLIKFVSITEINKIGKDLRKKITELEDLVKVARECGMEVSEFSIDISYQSPIKHF